jgi:hypothetical protein
MAELLQEGNDSPLGVVAAVVAANCNFHRCNTSGKSVCRWLEIRRAHSR